MTAVPSTARLARIRLHPIKALDPAELPEARIGPAGSLEHDRAWALYTADGRWVNGKRTAAVHLIRATYAPDVSSVTLCVPGDRRRIRPITIPFPDDAESAAEWFSVYFEQQIIVRYSADGFPDDTLAHGPTIVSTASLQTVCDLFPSIDLESARRRFRATLEIDGAPAFWEDRLFGPEETSMVRFRLGDVNFEGSNPCARCPVPPRDPQTGEVNTEFTRAFTNMRRSTIPPWTPEARFDHYYRFSTNTRIASSEAGKTLRVGDTLSLS
jgi:uncharacterized protein YcbX